MILNEVLYMCEILGANRTNIGISKTPFEMRIRSGKDYSERFSTIPCQIEECLNSQPLVLPSSNPEDLQALTPDHFLMYIEWDLFERPQQFKSIHQTFLEMVVCRVFVPLTAPD